MSIALLAAATLVSESPGLHRVAVEHRGAPLEARYDAKVTTRLEQVGMSAGTRMSTERCLWTANVEVQRHVVGGGERALSKTLPDSRTLTGSRHGDCRAARDGIAQEVARRSDDVRAHVIAVAERDRTDLHAEIDAARALAMN